MRHLIFNLNLDGPFPKHWRVAGFAMGCFWGAERLFWQQTGVKLTAVGYCGGQDPIPTYERVSSGTTGHAETVRVHYDPAEIAFDKLVKLFLENHDPTQYHRQDNDIGPQYRSVIFYTDSEQQTIAQKMLKCYENILAARQFGKVTTEILPLGNFYLAEPHHQQYLVRYPNGYCGLRGLGISCPIPAGASEDTLK